jgi:YfiH family protein
VEWVASSALDGKAAGLRHFFLTRRGGQSGGLFESLNVGYGRGDADASVAANRRRVAGQLGLPMEPVALRQVHGDKVVVVREGDTKGLLAAPPEADALVTSLHGVPLMVQTADCLPVVVCDTRTPALGVVHAGWRGTVLSILWKTVVTMMDEFGTRPEDCVAAVGPGIGPDCYEVGGEVRDAFGQFLPSYSGALFTPARDGRWNANLGEANRLQLVDALLRPDSIWVCPYCTHCESGSFFSARRDGINSGRQGAVAWLA